LGLASANIAWTCGDWRLHLVHYLTLFYMI
jgi:hypothetical protein